MAPFSGWSVLLPESQNSLFSREEAFVRCVVAKNFPCQWPLTRVSLQSKSFNLMKSKSMFFSETIFFFYGFCFWGPSKDGCFIQPQGPEFLLCYFRKIPYFTFKSTCRLTCVEGCEIQATALFLSFLVHGSQLLQQHM